MSRYKGTRYSRFGVENLEIGASATLPIYTVATAPAAAPEGSIAYISNGAAGAPVLAFSDGTNWLRSDTRAAIAAE
jgi:hypothetical protein